MGSINAVGAAIQRFQSAVQARFDTNICKVWGFISRRFGGRTGVRGTRTASPAVEPLHRR